MDVVFNCTHCGQELSVEVAGAGFEIQCPTCNGTLVVPKATNDNTRVVNPMSASAAAREEKHFSVPQREAGGAGTPAPLITKPLKPLEAAATEGIQTRIKTIRHSDCVEVGRDRFDEIVSQFVGKVGEANLVSINPITYSHQELGSRAWIMDFGVIVVYKG
jgi:DNA-directed RNA polymerase subunit RPC12/RpoP